MRALGTTTSTSTTADTSSGSGSRSGGRVCVCGFQYRAARPLRHNVVQHERTQPHLKRVSTSTSTPSSTDRQPMLSSFFRLSKRSRPPPPPSDSAPNTSSPGGGGGGGGDGGDKLDPAAPTEDACPDWKRRRRRLPPPPTPPVPAPPPPAAVGGGGVGGGDSGGYKAPEEAAASLGVGQLGLDLVMGLDFDLSALSSTAPLLPLQHQQRLDAFVASLQRLLPQLPTDSGRLLDTIFDECLRRVRQLQPDVEPAPDPEQEQEQEELIFGSYRRDCAGASCNALLHRPHKEVPLCVECHQRWVEAGSPLIETAWSRRGATLKELRAILQLGGVPCSDKSLNKKQLFNRIATLRAGGPPVPTRDEMRAFVSHQLLPPSWREWCERAQTIHN